MDTGVRAAPLTFHLHRAQVQALVGLEASGRYSAMSVLMLIVLGAIVCMLAHTMVNHSLSVAAALIVGTSSWASPAIAEARPHVWPDLADVAWAIGIHSYCDRIELTRR